MPIVYKITNKTTGKIYIGFTVRTMTQRWKSHLSSVRQGSNFRFHSAIRKYGVDDWDLEVLFESVDVDCCKIKEAELIEEYGSTDRKRGYNAKPGGCGGWIVPEDKYEEWLKKITENTTAEKNPRYNGLTNDDLLNIVRELSLKNNRIVSHKFVVEECKKKNINFPKTFSKMRFNGKYRNLVKILEGELCLRFDPYFKTEEHKKKLREANLGKKSPNKNTKVIVKEGKRIHVKN